MTHEYGDPLNQEAINAAVSQVLALQVNEPSEPLTVHVERALHETICSCALAIEDHVEGRRSGLHHAIAQQVHDGVKRAMLSKRECLPPLDRVDLASDQSFPASDPPGWI